jgi:hypothetical protein
MRGNYEELSCPFCDKGRIRCWHIPSSWSEKRQTLRRLAEKDYFEKIPRIRRE